MGPIDYDEELFSIGDLVEFIGYNYTPDYYVDNDDQMLGIVVEEVNTSLGYITNTWLYRVYWFKTKRISEVVAGHLKLVYAPGPRAREWAGLSNCFISRSIIDILDYL